jgi:pimeloyl-ACP methyl ester carboxylesterase
MPFFYAPDHLDRQRLPADSRTWVIVSKRAVETAVIFVHGFRGDALATWEGFEELAVQSSAFRNTDLYFFGYDGLLSNTLASSSFLYDLLDGLGNNPAQMLGTLAQGPLVEHRKLGYKKIILIAHSLGAVVCRWTLLRSIDQQSPWRDRIQTMYFAPAHCGSDLARLTGEASSGFAWLKGLVAGINASLPLLRELDYQSPIMRDLERRTLALAAANPILKPSKIVIAEREIVVNNWIFGQDPFPRALRGTDHITVCKPTRDLPEPFQMLEEMVK